jgi:cysteine desulfurase/selenocysteine lyase
MEHHSNLVPWILTAQATGATLRHVPITADGQLDLEAFERLLTPRVKLLSLTHKSNVLGTVNPVRSMADRAHAVGAQVVVDGAQAVGHLDVDLTQLGADAYAFSAHKALGPTGVGVLWARPELLESMDPFLGGGEMIREVHLDRATWNDVPWKFEAGTPNIAGVAAFAAAIDYLEGLGIARLHAHEVQVTRYALQRLGDLGFLRLFGPAEPEQRPGVVAFYDKDVHPHDLSTVLDTYAVAVRAGHHCAQPLMRRMGVVATARASFHCYNDRDDIDALVDALVKTREYFGHVVS